MDRRNHSEYRPEIDGLRALAVIPVVLYHAGVPFFGNGYLGVDVFFVISGYLITGLLARDSHPDILRFYERRLRRIAPALLVVLATTAFLGLLVLTPIRLNDLARAILFLPVDNFWFLTQTVYMGTPESENPLIHLWSLAVEEQFYLVFPVVVWVTAPIGRIPQIGVLSLLAIFSLLVSIFVAQSDPNSAFFRSDTRAWELLLGAVCALLPSPRGVWLVPSGITLILLSYFVLPGPTAPTLWSLPVCGGTALILMGSAPAAWPTRLLGALPLRAIGLISYSLYLWHQPLLALGRIASPGDLSIQQTFAIIAVSLILAALSWHIVEQPARNRARLGTGTLLYSLGTGCVVVAAFGLTSLATLGMAFRYGDNAPAYFASLSTIDVSGDVRSKAIRMGTCHYRADRSPPLEVFLANWNCQGSSSGRGILIVGDSHAADVAAGFELNGYDVGQMTGAGCPLAPSLMDEACREMFDTLTARPAKYELVVLGNDQTGKTYAPEDISAALTYWGKLAAPIVWLSDMPQFPELEDLKAQHVLASGTAMSGSYPAALDAARANFSSLERLAGGRFRVLDSAGAYCSLTEANGACLPYLAGQAFLAAPLGHLTALGARLFVNRLLSREPLARWKEPTGAN